MPLLLKNVTNIDNEQKDVHFPEVKETKTIDFSGHFIYPGLTNWHDHLEMNLYPRLGTPPYNNYTEWMKDIYKPKESPLKEIERTDIEYRLLWGGLKNLISGVTTVYHHNPSRRILRKESFPVFVPEISWAHSLAVEKALRYERHLPFIIHAAEGVDELARNEIHQLDDMGVLQKNTFIVHGISAGATLVNARNATLIWCPSSNLYMFNKTADVTKFNNVVLGTDSTLTGSPTLLDEMRVASQFMSKGEIFEMVKGEGFFIARKITGDPLENLFLLQPKDIVMVISRGKIRLEQGKPVGFDLNKLHRHFERKVGIKILEQNPLWQILS